MRYVHLGSSGLKVSNLAYGSWLTHGTQVSPDGCRRIIHTALDHGINTFDTADSYAAGAAESILGDVLHGVHRGSLVLCTKVFWPTGGMGGNDSGLSRKHIMESIDGSLSRLRTSYVDVFQAGRFDVSTPLEETMAAFSDVVRQGKAHYIGVSEWPPEKLEAAQSLAKEMHVPFVSNQAQYSLLWRVAEGEVIPTCRRLGLGLVAWSPLTQGLLTGKYLPGQPPPYESRAAHPEVGSSIGAIMNPKLLEAVAALQPIAQDAGVSVAQLALAWVLSNPDVSCAIVGASRPEQLTENVRVFEMSLGADVLQAASSALLDVAVLDPAKAYDSTPTQRPS